MIKAINPDFFTLSWYICEDFQLELETSPIFLDFLQAADRCQSWLFAAFINRSLLPLQIFGELAEDLSQVSLSD